MDNESINNVIMHLNNSKIHEDYAWIQMYGNNGKKVSGLSVIVDELKRLNLVSERHDAKGHPQYLLNLNTRNSIKNLPIEFEGKPYEYFLDEERKQKESELSKKWYETENAKKQFENLPAIESRARWSIRISIGAILVSILLQVIEWKCPKPNPPVSAILNSRP